MIVPSENEVGYCQAAGDGGSGDKKERACDSLLMCIVTTMNQGLRNGGGIGDILRAPSSNEPLFVPRVIYDLLFFFIVIIIVLNLIFGVIIDTFADLRSEKQQKELILKNTCFVCGKYYPIIIPKLQGGQSRDSEAVVGFCYFSCFHLKLTSPFYIILE